MAECFNAYLDRPGGVRPRDLQPLNAMEAAMGDRPLAEASAAWNRWVDAHPKHSAGTLAKYRNILRAALRHGAARHGLEAPKLLPVKEEKPEAVPVLTDREREALLAAYNPDAARPALVLAYQGARTSETLLLDWRWIDLKRESIYFPAHITKNGKARSVPMHPRVSAMLRELRAERGEPQSGPVFLSARGEAYAAQREAGGGNPLDTAHKTACRRAGVRDFRIHDWRHDWAARMVMAGVDLLSLQQLGGWEDLRSVKRYASVTADHLREAARRIA